MPRPRKLYIENIVQVAIEIANETSFEAVTLVETAKRLNSQPPSLFNYIEGVSDLRDRMRLRGVELLTEHVKKAIKGKTSEAALRGVALGYRDFARTHPGLYSPTLQLDRVKEPPISTAWETFVAITLSVMMNYGLTERESLHMMRTLGSMMHGFVDLERAVGFVRPADPDESYERMIDIFIRGMRSYYSLSNSTSSEA